jgi:hypothetical protein
MKVYVDKPEDRGGQSIEAKKLILPTPTEQSPDAVLRLEWDSARGGLVVSAQGDISSRITINPLCGNEVLIKTEVTP